MEIRAKYHHLVLALLLVVPVGSAHAADWSVWGGRVIPSDATAFRAAAGWTTDLSYHIPLDKRFELAPKFGVFFGSPLMSMPTLHLLRDKQGGLQAGEYAYGQCCGIGNTVGLEIRVAIVDAGRFHAALKGEAAGLLLYGDSTELGMTPGARVGMGIAMDLSALDNVNLVGGADLISDLYFEPAIFVLPLLFRGGIEYLSSPRTAIFAMTRVGPGFVLFTPGVVDTQLRASAAFAVDGIFGFAYRFGGRDRTRAEVDENPESVGVVYTGSSP